MTAIILCPGPSLARYTPQPADMVLAVNRAALACPCDWWCCCDYPPIRDYADKVLGTPNLMSIKQTVMDIGRHAGKLDRFNDIRLIEDIPATFCPMSDRPWGWSTFTSALVFASWIGASRIDVYGADWAGKQDYDGIESGNNREDARWEKERRLFDEIVTILGARGTEIIRHELCPSLTTS